MENITGNPVTYKDFFKGRLFLVEDLKKLLRKHSVIIEAPRRFGKTSLIKEFMRQENAKEKKNQEFNVLYLELEGEETVSDFCFYLFKELLNLYHFRKKLDTLSNLLGGTWNALASRLQKLKIPGLELELRAQTRDYNISQWKEKITSLIANLNSFDTRTVIAFDEFPDMLMNFKKKDPDGLNFKDTIDVFMAWLRSLRQTQADGCKYQFVFAGSIHLRKTLESMGISKRINDLESFLIPPIKEDEALLFLESLTQKHGLQIEQEGITYMVAKITGGSLYYGQIMVKALKDSRGKFFLSSDIKTIYEEMLRRGDHDLNHYHSRFEDYLTSLEKESAQIILKHLCHEPAHEKDIYNLHLFETCSYEQFQTYVNRLIYEGYIARDICDNARLRFVTPILKDWWACKVGVDDVCL